MTESLVEEAQVARDERRSGERMQERYDLLIVLHSLPAEVLADLSKTDPQRPQPATLVFRNVLVEQDHEFATEPAQVGAHSRSAWRASEIDSAIAA
jgi:hypothetical protein